ncbi:UbiD family decarboxylase [Geodermatophilus sp. SYSU D00708]
MPGTLPATAPWPAAPDLRGWLTLVQADGQLGVVGSPIDADQDVAAVLEQADGRRAVLFTDVLGADFPLVGNAVLDRAGLARAMGCGPREAAARFAAALDAPRPCREVGRDDAPVLANRMDGDRLLSRLPIPVQHERDAGRYLTSALLAVRDPVSGVMNLSINRMLAVGERELRVLVLAGRLRGILAQAEREGRDLDAAVLIGVDPLLELASQAPADRDLADLEVAGALGPGPLPVVACPTVDAVVPAGVEFVLEGRFRAGARAPEGPFGEFPRTYGPGGPVPVLELSAGWHRDDAVAQTVLSGGREHFLVGGVPREAALARGLARTFACVTGVRLPESGSCRLTAVVALHEPGPGTAVDVVMAVFALSTLVKSVVVVDDDVDIHDDEDVAWAVATRVRAERDLLVVPRSRGSSLDPTTVDGTVTKLGIDATVPPSERERYARMRVAPSDVQTIGRYLAEAGVPVRSRG